MQKLMKSVAMGGLAAVLLCIAAGCEDKAEGGSGSVLPEVTVVQIAPVTVPVTLEQIGQTQASQSVEIRSRVQGFLTAREFEEGKPVKKDDVLFRIDPQPFDADRKIAEARLSQAQARLARAQREARRLELLVAQDAGSRKELDDAQTTELEAAADIKLYAAQAEKAKLDLSYTTIKSPFDGVIGESFKDVGALVDAGQNSLLAKVTQLDPIYVSVTFSEREGLALYHDIGAGRLVLPAGRKVQVSLKLVDGTQYGRTGTVNFIAPEIDPQTGTARLRAQLPNPDGVLTHGQFVRATFSGYERLNAILVPQRSVLQSPSGPFVYIVGAGETIEPRQVVLGKWLGDQWVVEQGLAAGDPVVVDGAQKVRPGMQVKTAASTPATRPATPGDAK